MTSVNKFLKLIIGILLSALGLFYAFRQLDWGAFLTQLSQVNLWWIFFAVVLMIYSVWIRALRWKLILEPFEQLDTHTLFGSCMIGYFGNNVLPFRLGEVLRAYSISHNRPISFSSSFGTLILERLLDMLGLIVLMAVLMVFYPLAGWMSGMAYVVIGGTLFVFAVIIWVGKASGNRLGRIHQWIDNRSGVSQKLFRFILEMIDGITALKNTHHVSKIMMFTAMTWAMYYVDAWMITQALNVDISLVGIGIVLVTATLSIIIPAAPGYIGTYHAAIVYVGTTLFALSLSTAQAFAIIIHSIGFVPFVIIGAVYFFRSSLHLSDVKGRNV